MNDDCMTQADDQSKLRVSRRAKAATSSYFPAFVYVSSQVVFGLLPIGPSLSGLINGPTTSLTRRLCGFASVL